MKESTDVNTPVKLRLVGVAQDGSIVPPATGATVSFESSSSNAMPVEDDDQQGATIPDTTPEVYTLKTIIAGTDIPLEDDSKTIEVTVTAVQSGVPVSHRIVRVKN